MFSFAGKISISIAAGWCEPYENTTEYIEACEREDQFDVRDTLCS